MADFDPNNYFARRNSALAGTDKIDALVQASQDKVQALAKRRIELEQQELQNADSWVSQNNLAPDSPAGIAANLGASLVSGASRVVGQLVGLRNNFEAIADESLLSDADVAAYNRHTQGVATPEDLARLNEPRTRGSVMPGKQAPTALELFERSIQSRKEAVETAKTFDLQGIVHQGNRSEFAADLGDTFEQDWGQTQQGWEAIKNGELGIGVADTVAGLSKLLVNAGDAIANNKMAALEYIVENVPQIAVGALGGGAGTALLTASNAGYAAEYYSKGIEAYQDKHGKLPTGDERESIAWHAASLAIAEQVGDLSILAPLKKLRGAPDAGDVARAGFKDALLNVGKTTSRATATEAATEGYQTYAEGEVLGKPASAEDIYVGTVIGGVAGGGLSGGISTLAEASQLGSESLDQARQRSAERGAVKAAVEAGDPSAFLDSSSPAYDPAKAIQVLHGMSQKEDATPEAREANLKQASALVNELEAKKADLEESLSAATPEGLQQRIDAITAQQAQLDPADTQKAADLQQMREFLEADLADAQDPAKAKATAAHQEALRKQLAAMDQQIATARTRLDVMANQFTPKTPELDVEAEVAAADSADTAVAQASGERIINLAMRAPEQLSPEQARQLAGNSGNGLTTAQRSYLGDFAQARDEERNLRSMSQVAQRVYHGYKSDIGISQYQQRFAQAVAIGDQKAAERHLGMLTKFAADHAAKATAIQQAGMRGQVIKEGGVWQVTSGLSDAEIRAKSGLTINSPRLLAEIPQEARAVSAAAREMAAAFALKFTAAPAAAGVKSSSTVNTQSTESTPSTAVSQSSTVENQSNVDLTVDAAPSVDAATPVAEVQQTEAPASTEAQAAPVEAAPNIEAAAPNTPEEAPNIEVAEPPPVEVQQGTLNTFAQPATEGQPYQKRNLIRDFFRQSVGGLDGTQRPLAAVKDFLSQWAQDGTLVERFLALKEPLTAKQGELLKAFPAFAAELRPFFLKNLVLAKNADYRFKDLMTFFAEAGPDGKPIVEENLLTAMSYAAFSWIAENASRSMLNDDDEINAILGRDEDTIVSSRERERLGLIGTRQNVIVNALGQRAVQALGLKAVKDAPMDLQPRLEATIGAHILKMLLDPEVGVFEREEISKADMAKLMKASEDKSAPGQFIRFKRTDGQLAGTVTNIQALSKETRGILDKLFSVEPGVKMPSLTPVPYTQGTTKNTHSRVPQKLKEILEAKNAEANYLRQDMWHLLENIGPEAVLDMMGAESVDAADTHISRRENNQAKNDALAREYERFMEFVRGTLLPSEKGVESPFYFEHTAWRQQRVGIATNGVNPQTSKLHRFLMFRKSWETQVDTTSREQMENFKLRVMEGLGVKTDKQSNKKSLAGFEILFDPAHADHALAKNPEKSRQQAEARNRAVEVLVQVLAGEAMNAEKQAALVAGVKAGGEKFHSLDALMAMAHYRSRGDSATFTVQMMGEVDGVTNGPMLSHLLLGAARSAKDLFKVLNRGGFYEQGNAHTQYNVWREAANHLDLYETTSLHMMQAVDRLGRQNRGMQPVLGAIFKLTGDLVDTAGKVTKEGRNIIKTPLTAMVFGSSLSRAVESMAENFVDTVLDRFEASVDMDITQRQTMLRQVNALLPASAQIPLNSTAQQLLDLKLTELQEAALKNAFQATVGEAVKQTMEADFKDFMGQTRQLNTAAQLAYELHNAVYTTLRQQFITELIAREKAQPGTGLAHGKADNPLHDLNTEQEKELRKRVARFSPVMHTLMSKDSGSLASGLLMAKSQRKFSQDDTYKSEVHFATPFPDNGAKTTYANSYTIAGANPGVGTAPMSIHSTDSAISHYAAALAEVLNIHDAHGAGLGLFEQTARNLNQATWNAMLNYSPASEVSAALVRVVQGLAQFLEQDNVPAPVLQALGEAVTRFAKKNRIDDPLRALDDTLARTKEIAYHADAIKLDVLSQLASVDQYALEGGNYTVTDTDRAAAAAKKTALSAHLDQATVDSLNAISDKLLPFLGKRGAQEAVREDDTTSTGLEGFPAVQGLQLLDHGIRDESLSADLRQRMQRVREVMLAKRISLSDALNQVLGSYRELSNRDGIISYLANRWREVPPALWGERGTPVNDSDPELVALFEARGELTAAQVLQALKRKTEQAGNPRMKEFTQRILAVLAKTVDPQLQFKYVTPALAPDQVLEKGADRARGWYVAKGGQAEIYVLSPDYKHSGLTAELLLHELVHAALAGTIAAPTGEAAALVQELDALRKKAQEFVAAQGLSQYSEALGDVQEFVAWGMSNLGFQKDVLNRISMESKTWSNQLVSGMKSFIGAIVRLLFKDVDQRREAVARNGMALLISNVSGLFNAAAQQKSQVELVLNQVGPDPLRPLTTHQVFDGLAQASSELDGNPAFLVHLRGLLSGIVNELHGPWGSFKAHLEANVGLSALDAFQKAQDDGMAPFASKILASPFRTPEPAAFVLEQVEATVRAALEDNTGQTTAAYKELTRLYLEVRAKVKPQDFHDGDWASATVAERHQAQALHDFVFAIESNADGRSDYLARFAAMGLAHPQMRQILDQATAADTRKVSDGKTFIERLQIIFDKILNFLNGRLTHTWGGQPADEKLTMLVNQLVGIEAKKRRLLARTELSLLASTEEGLRGMSEAARAKVGALVSQPWLRQSRFPVVRAASGAVAIIAKDRVDALMEVISDLQNKHTHGVPGLLTGLMREFKGPREFFQAMLRAAKTHERQRKFMITETAKVALESFANQGQDLTDADKAAISAVFLRTDMAALLDSYDIEALHGMLTQPQQLERAIQSLEQQLGQFGTLQHFYTKAAKLLAYYKATGEVRGEHVLMNARNIARLVGTPHQSRVTDAQAQVAEGLLDQLVSLYALRYTGAAPKAKASRILAAEMARTDQGNGVEMVLRLHKQMQQQSRDRLFQGSEALMMKGYTPEIYNPHTDLRVATAAEGTALEDLGYVRGAPVARDPADPDTATKFLYVMKDGGLSPYLTGLFSLTSLAAKGSTQHNGNVNLASPEGVLNASLQAQITSSKQAGIQRMFRPDPGFDPAQEAHTYLAPVVNPDGVVVNYRYLMQETTKDSLLERDGRFDKVLGTMAGSIYDKVSSQEQNVKAIEALHDVYQNEYATNPDAFVVIGMTQADAELRDIYRLLPESTRHAVRAVWGQDNLVVRKDLVEFVFGYRKASLGDVFDRVAEDREAAAQGNAVRQGAQARAEALLVQTTEWVLREFAVGMNVWRRNRGLPSQDVDRYVKRAAMIVRRNERMWQEVVTEMKDLIVNKTGVVLLGNILSNVSLLAMNGVPLGDMLRHHRVAMKGALAYQKDQRRLHALQTQLDAGYLFADEAEMRHEVARLQDAMARNPVRELIEAGLMPTIVEDVAAEEDIYSYKSRFVRKTDALVSRLPEKLVSAGRLVYMAHDTKLYQTLSHVTQLSDFVARYTLYQHLTTKRDALTPAEAIQEASDAFVNYDIPMPRGMQYLDDMGITMFTKYFLRIQRVLLKLTREHPARVIGLMLLNQFYHLMPIVTDSSVMAHLGNNPFGLGPVNFPGTLDELMTVQAGLALVK